jgi:hypothetical protein
MLTNVCHRIFQPIYFQTGAELKMYYYPNRLSSGASCLNQKFINASFPLYSEDTLPEVWCTQRLSHHQQTVHGISQIVYPLLSRQYVYLQTWIQPWNKNTQLLIYKGKGKAIPVTGRGGLVGCPWLLIQYIRSYPPYLEAVSSILNLRTRHAMVTRDPPNMVCQMCHLKIRAATGGRFFRLCCSTGPYQILQWLMVMKIFRSQLDVVRIVGVYWDAQLWTVQYSTACFPMDAFPFMETLVILVKTVVKCNLAPRMQI